MQARESLPDPAVAMDIEIVGLQELRHVVVDLGINQDRPHDGFLGFPIVRDAGCCRGGGRFDWRELGHFFLGLFGLSGFSAPGSGPVS